MTFSHDGTRIASVSDDQTVRLWNAATGESLRTFDGHTDQLYTPRFTPDGRYLVTASQAGVVKVWDLETGGVRELRGHTDVVVGVALSRDATNRPSASDDTTVRLWELDSGRAVRVLRGHTDMVNAVAFSPDGKLLASASYDQTVRIWAIDPGTESTGCAGTGFVWAVAFRRTADSWHPPAATRPSVFGRSRPATSGSHSPGTRAWCGRRVCTGRRSRCGRLGQDGTPLGHNHRPGTVTLRAHDAVNAIAFNPDGTRLASAGDDRTITVWVADRATKGTRHGTHLPGTHRAVLSVAFSPTVADSRRQATITARVWDVESGSVLCTLAGHSARWAVSRSHRTGRVSRPRARQDSSTLGCAHRTRIARTPRAYRPHLRLAFSPDGRWLATGSWDRTVRSGT